MSKNLTALSGRQGLDNNLFERLGALAEAGGSPDAEALRRLAEEYLMGPANLYGAATFYDFTRPENAGKQVYVCTGTACRLAGTQDEVRAQLSTHFRAGEIGEMSCLGRCHENGAFQYRGRTYSGPVAATVERALHRPEEVWPDPYTVRTLGPALLTAPAPGIDECRRGLARVFAAGDEALLADIRTSGLRGRGGAGFPLAAKLAACRTNEAGRRFIVCNADEGDPGSYSDRFLLEERPRVVLLGMVLAGFAAGADRGVVYVRAEYPEAISAVERAAAELAAHGLSGEDILGSGFTFHIKLIKARGAYICGEETALLASIEGQRPEVRLRPPYPAQEGLFGRPTVVSNVETLANLYPIATRGGAAFAARGAAASTGTKLLSFDSAFRRPGVYEVDMGTPLGAVIDQLAGGFRRPVKALHIGGPLGGLVPRQRIDDLTVDFESFARHGFLLGHASVIGIPDDYPLIEYLEHLFAFTAHESCGKCFPCRLGSQRGRELLEGARTRGEAIDPVLFDDLLDTLERGSLCGLGGGMPLPVRNALTYFHEELAPFFATVEKPVS